MLLTKTTELAVQSLLYLASQPEHHRFTPAEVAGCLGESPTYMSKVLRALAKAGLLRSRRGKIGGFGLARVAEQITLLEVVEACQGIIAGNYCEEENRRPERNTCGYHQAMLELQTGICEILGRWNLQQVLDARPPPPDIAPNCKLRKIVDRPAERPAARSA